MKIHLNEMLFYGYHGVYPEERKLGQKFYVTLTVFIDDSLDANICNLSDTVDYTKIYETVKQIMEKEQFYLLEECANKIINSIFNAFSLISGVKILIEKPCVPMKCNLKSVSVEMERQRS